MLVVYNLNQVPLASCLVCGIITCILHIVLECTVCGEALKETFGKSLLIKQMAWINFGKSASRPSVISLYTVTMNSGRRHDYPSYYDNKLQ